MAGKATTFRIEPVVMDGLEKLSAILKKPLNKLANEAIREYVATRMSDVEADLASTLEGLRAYRKRDPDFEQSLSKFVDAEVSAKDDPAEGTVLVAESEPSEGSCVGPAQKAVLKVLK